MDDVSTQRQIEPDAKDWTWVLERACAQCGFDPGDVAPADLAGRLRASAAGWPEALSRADATRRPDEHTWSPTEYACHVRDVHRLFAQRLRLMLDQDDPLFENWDQDATAVEERYDLQDPATVEPELREAAETVAAIYAGVTGAQWDRPGRRSNGSVFTVATLGTYHLHDVEHHLWDVRH